MRPPPRGVTTTTPPLGIELQIQKVARARARLFSRLRNFAGGSGKARSSDATIARNKRTQRTHATNSFNAQIRSENVGPPRTHARTQQTRSTQNKIRKHAKSRTTAENIAYRTNQLPVRAKEF